MRHAMLTALLLALPAVAHSEPAALVVAAEDYDHFPSAERAHDVISLRSVLARAGYDVSVARDRNFLRVANAFETDAGREGARFAVLAGRFVNDGTRAWLLPEEADEPRLFDTADLLSVDSVLRVAAEGDDPAIVLLAEAEASRGASVSGLLEAGLPKLSVPEGVAVIAGPIPDIVELARAMADRPMRDQREMVRRNPALRVVGELPFSLRLDARNDARATAAFERARNEATLGAFRAFLVEHPNASEAAQARDEVRRLENDPKLRAERAEAALELSPQVRRSIQRDLNTLGYSTRGVDGIFGRGTRDAVSSWQRDEGRSVTSFLTSDQIDMISEQAGNRRAAERAEQERRAQARAEADRAFWRETGARGDEAGLRAYLERYPEGQHAREAKDELARIEQDRRAIARVQDDRLWREVREADTRSGYQRYLDRYPRGAHADAARQNLRAFDNLSQPPRAPAPNPPTADSDSNTDQEDPRTAVARAQEERLGLDRGLRVMVELGLGTLGFNPGNIDGEFDQRTRDAIKRFQSDKGLSPTGFIDAATSAKLLTGSIGG